MSLNKKEKNLKIYKIRALGKTKLIKITMFRKQKYFGHIKYQWLAGTVVQGMVAERRVRDRPALRGAGKYSNTWKGHDESHVSHCDDHSAQGIVNICNLLIIIQQ